MKKVKLLFFIAFAVLLASGVWVYTNITDETYQGMSIIPEDEKDIPLYEGLKPRRSDYVIKGNHWEGIYQFYLKELPANGWKLRHKESALDDSDPGNDWSGFLSSWTKDDVEGELTISAGYNSQENITETIFDHQSHHD